MGTKTIRLEEDVYEHLKSKKRDDETFSDAVARLTEDWSLLELVESYTDEQAAEHRALLGRSEEAAAENREALLEQLAGEDK